MARNKRSLSNIGFYEATEIAKASSHPTNDLISTTVQENNQLNSTNKLSIETQNISGKENSKTETINTKEELTIKTEQEQGSEINSSDELIDLSEYEKTDFMLRNYDSKIESQNVFSETEQLSSEPSLNGVNKLNSYSEVETSTDNKKMELPSDNVLSVDKSLNYENIASKSSNADNDSIKNNIETEQINVNDSAYAPSANGSSAEIQYKNEQFNSDYSINRSNKTEQISGTNEQLNEDFYLNNGAEQNKSVELNDQILKALNSLLNSNSKTVQNDETMKIKTVPVPERNVEKEIEFKGEVQSQDNFLNHYHEQIEKRKPLVEETHTRDTYLIRNDLLERFNRLAKNEKKGFKMRFINYVLEKELDKIEKSNRR